LGRQGDSGALTEAALIINPIKTEADYQEALKDINLLFDAQSGTEEFDRLDVLATLVQAYEKKVFPIEPPDSFDAIFIK
jgi:HTH-type transcriptional regulator/antitoxin HigA